MDYETLNRLKKSKKFDINQYWSVDSGLSSSPKEAYALSVIQDSEFVGAYTMLENLHDEELVPSFKVLPKGDWRIAVGFCDYDIPGVAGELPDFEVDLEWVVDQVMDIAEEGNPATLKSVENFALKLREFSDRILAEIEDTRARNAEKPE